MIGEWTGSSGAQAFAERTAAKARNGVRRLSELLAAYARSRKAGAMLYSGAVVLMMMAGSGAALSNYGWREAQWEELRTATRAAIAAAGLMLDDAGTPAGDRQIKERVAAYLEGAMPGLSIDVVEDDIAIVRDANDVISISVEGSYVFDNIWVRAPEGAATKDTTEDVTTGARVELVVDRSVVGRQELALAVGTSSFMNQILDPTFGEVGGRYLAFGKSRMQVLQDTLGDILAEVHNSATITPGSIMVSIVPYMSAVNVADTCGSATPGGSCTNRRTPAKERYVRMLAGARASTARTLADARAAVAAGKRTHWVDTFRHYGISRASPLNHRHLPSDLLNDIDWNLRRTGIRVDVSRDVPSRPVWIVDDEDFWGGCVMARWGAYWDADARPRNWDVTSPANWPATKRVERWSRRGSRLPRSTPLHLSDAPPVASDPNTLFTAYSWPDDRIGDGANEKLHKAMVWTISPQVQPPPSAGSMIGEMRWSWPSVTVITTLSGNSQLLHGRFSGRGTCPTSPLQPLSADLEAVIDNFNALQYTPTFPTFTGFSSVNAGRGIVWALRTLSPLWRQVWQVRDPDNKPRPGVVCAPRDTRGCDDELTKRIVLAFGGSTIVYATMGESRLMTPWGAPNRSPALSSTGFTMNTPPPWPCRSGTGLAPYQDAALASNEADFTAYFRAAEAGEDLVDADGRLNRAGILRVAEALLRAEGTECAIETARCANMINDLLADPPTPWQLFHTLDDNVVDTLMGASFNFTGRPTLLGHMCRPHTQFTVYGRGGDRIEAGDGTWIEGESPFTLGDFANRKFSGPADHNALSNRRGGVAEDWLLDACRIAGRRGVEIDVIYMSGSSFYGAPSRTVISLLERCVDAAGGDPQEDDVFLASNERDVRDAFTSIILTTRTLRFLD